MSSGSRLSLLVISCAAWLAPPDARAGAPDPGQPGSSASSRPASRLVGCSVIEPVCVHEAIGAPRLPGAAALTLAAGERALAFLRRQGMPGPRPDGALGTGPELDLYLTSLNPLPQAHADPADLVGVHESASAYGVLDARRGGCALESDVARVVAQTALLGLAPSAHASTLAVGSSQIASLAAPCPFVESTAVDAFQRHPERALTHANLAAFAGEFLWADFLDTRYGKHDLGRLWPELVALTGQRRSPTDLASAIEPDMFDVLRRLLVGLGTSLDDAQLEFAIARAFVGTRSDGAHLVDVERHGDLGRVRFDWTAAWSSLPRRLRTSVLEATGASYLWLDTRGAGPKGRLEVAVECEVTHAFRWALVTIDAEGKELGRHVGGRFGEHEIRLSLASLENVDAVLLVGATGGHDDREHPFDPEEGPPAEAVCEVSLFPG